MSVVAGEEFAIEIPASLARRLFEAQEVNSYDYFMLKHSIESGERAEARRQVILQQAAERDAREAAKRAALPLSERGTRDECGDEFNRCRRLYNFQWQHQYDLTSIGGLIIHAYNGTWVGTSNEVCPRQLLKIVEHGIKEGLFGEPFVGPLYEYKDEE